MNLAGITLVCLDFLFSCQGTAASIARIGAEGDSSASPSPPIRRLLLPAPHYPFRAGIMGNPPQPLDISTAYCPPRLAFSGVGTAANRVLPPAIPAF